MKLKYDFVINQVAGETVAVSVGNNDGQFNGYIKLNETGAEIFKALKKDTTREQIVELLLQKYPDATENQVSESVDELLKKLNGAQLLI